MRFRRKGGWLNTALYLKTFWHALMVYYGGTFEKETRYSVSISLSRDGIPRCIPEFHRRMIRMRDCKADRLVQLYLSFFSISKLILLVRARYPLKGIARRVEVDELLEGLGELYEEFAVPLFERYIPSYLKKPMEIGFRWRPTWSSVPNSGSGRWGKNAWKAFLAELAAPYDWFRVMTAEVSSPNLSDWSTHLGLIDCAGVFFRRRDIYPIPSSLDEPIQSSWECWWKLWTLCSQVDQDHIKDVIPNDNSTLVLIPGRLAEKMEGAGKLRVFAIPSQLKQCLLRPAHDWAAMDRSHGWDLRSV